MIFSWNKNYKTPWPIDSWLNINSINEINFLNKNNIILDLF